MGSLHSILSRNRLKLKPELCHQINEANGWWKPPYTHSNQDLDYLHLGSHLFDPTKSILQNILKDKFLITGDVRLDNKKEIAAKYPDLPANLTDWDIIAWLYYHIKLDLLQEIIGSFAFILYDKQLHELYAITDHIGTKPLYYYLDDDIASIGTQKKTCILSAPNAKIPNWEFLFENILYYEHLEDATEYKHIKRLPPGSYLKISPDDHSVIRYWKLDTSVRTTYNREQDYVDHFVELMQKAVAARMHNQPTVAAHLSGGLDSSGIVGIGAEIGKKIGSELQAFSYTVPNEVKVPDQFVNDNALVKQQADFAGIYLHKVDSIIKRLKRRVLEYEASWLDGFAELNKLNIEYEMQTAIQTKGIHVCLSGFMGDELPTSFARAHYLDYLDEGKYIKLLLSKHKGKRELKNTMGPLTVKVLTQVGLLDKSKSAQIFHRLKYGKTSRMKEWKNHLFSHKYFQQEVFDKVYKENNRSEYLYGIPLSLREHQMNHVHRRISSARMHSENLSGLNYHVEYRYPLADIRLLSYVLSLPTEIKISPDMNRKIYRMSMKNYIHPDILYRDNKVGHVKPMSAFYVDKSWQSMTNLFYYLQKKSLVPYLDQERFEEFFKQGQVPPHMQAYLMYGELANQNKMIF